MEFEFSLQIFEKYLDIKFHVNLSTGSRVVPCGRTDRYAEVNSRNSAKAPKNILSYLTIHTRHYHWKKCD
jgi:hypothetical protein